MHNDDFGAYGSTTHQGPYGAPDNGGPDHRSVFSLVVMIAVVALAAIVGLSIAFWALGLLFHLAGLIFKVAILAAVAALVWRRVSRHRCRNQI